MNVAECLAPYRPFLDQHTAEAIDGEWEPQRSRYASFRLAFDHLRRTGGRTIVELGTIRSYVHGGLPGCNDDDPSFWRPDAPERWDWGAGCFSLLAAICLADASPTIHTVDIVPGHIERCKIVTADHSHLFQYHVCDSVAFLRSLPRRSVDLVYLDTGDMWPIEPTARHQLAEVKQLHRRRVLADQALVLIDDVRNLTPRRFGETSCLGKAKYSIPYLLKHGFEVVFDGYQVALTDAGSRAKRLRRQILRLT